MAAFLQEEVVEEVGHAQWVFTVPKMLRVYFLRLRRAARSDLLTDERTSQYPARRAPQDARKHTALRLMPMTGLLNQNLTATTQ